MPILKVPVTTEDHVQGEENAWVTLVEYGDYECPFCGNAYPVVKKLQKHFDKQLRFVFRNFPLSQVHPYAEAAAETAEFAAANGHFWQMHDLIYENQSRLGIPLLLELTEQIGLSVRELELAIEKKTFKPKVQKDFLGGLRSGVNGTPTFFINEHRYNGAFDFESLAAGIGLVIPR
jgi:protein-disulfide isomerase